MHKTEIVFGIVILAAGNASRFGRYKQIEAITNDGETLVELNIKNALLHTSNFEIVVVTTEDLRLHFETILNKFNVRKKSVVIQNNDALTVHLKSTTDPKSRLGVGHALWIGIQELSSSFIVMNADDYYSPDVLRRLISALANSTDITHHFMVGYTLRNTVFNNSQKVNRGVCKLSYTNQIKHINIVTEIVADSDNITGRMNGEITSLSGEEVICMNLYGFNQSIFPHIELFVSNAILQMEAIYEIGIHAMLNELLHNNQILLINIPVDEKCLGLTNASDVEMLKQFLNDRNAN